MFARFIFMKPAYLMGLSLLANKPIMVLNLVLFIFNIPDVAIWYSGHVRNGYWRDGVSPSGAMSQLSRAGSNHSERAKAVRDICGILCKQRIDKLAVAPHYLIRNFCNLPQQRRKYVKMHILVIPCQPRSEASAPLFLSSFLKREIWCSATTLVTTFSPCNVAMQPHAVFNVSYAFHDFFIQKRDSDS